LSQLKPECGPNGRRRAGGKSSKKLRNKGDTVAFKPSSENFYVFLEVPNIFEEILGFEEIYDINVLVAKILRGSLLFSEEYLILKYQITLVSVTLTRISIPVLESLPFSYLSLVYLNLCISAENVFIWLKTYYFV